MERLVTSKTFLSQGTVMKTGKTVKMRRRIRGGEWKESGGERNGIASGKKRGKSEKKERSSKEKEDIKTAE